MSEQDPPPADETPNEPTISRNQQLGSEAAGINLNIPGKPIDQTPVFPLRDRHRVKPTSPRGKRLPGSK